MRLASLLLISATLGVSACSPMVQTRGHVKDPEWESVIQPGVAGREDVAMALGSPSTRSSFGPETWYYITTRRESYAFFDPDITDQDVLAVTFDQSGLVEKVEQVGKDGLTDIEYTSRETPTEGHSLTFLEQIVGNLGRFNSPTSGAAGRGPGGR